MKHFVGVDIGGTRIKAGLVNAERHVVSEVIAWLQPEDRSEEGLIRRLAEVVEDVAGDLRPASVGIGIPGVVDHARGVVAKSPSFPAWHGFHIRDRLTQALNLPVLVDNDANCVIAGEALAGAGVGHRSLIGLTLGTGVGGGIILDGAMWRGVSGMAGELGHIVADPQGPPCGCGGRGCLEMYASVNGLRALCTESPVEGADPAAPNLPELVAARALAGDLTARAHLDAMARPLGRVLGSLLNVFNVKTVILAGGVSGLWPHLHDPCWTALRGACFADVLDGVKIVLGTLGERAGVVGAALQGIVSAANPLQAASAHPL